MALPTINPNAVSSTLDAVKTALENPIVAATAGGVSGLAVGIGAAAAVSAVKKRTTRRKKKSTKKKTSRGRRRDRMFKSKQKHERKYKRKRKYKVYGRKGYITPKGKRTKKRPGKVYYTKNGQPYKIMASGKARFIKGKRRKR